ncbi:MAG: hypothetical protein PHU63_02970 [Candidatus ainarchaeum sp.]|nr:hypothetical protein [Candidatus ainarchaeum sp.]
MTKAKEESSSFLGIKGFAVVVLFVLAAVSVYYFYFLNSEENTPDNTNFEQLFLQNLYSSDIVYIVMDTRNMNNQNIKEGVMQCGVDFAGSQALAGKEILSMALEEETCWFQNKTTIEECAALYEKGPTLYITSNSKTGYSEKTFIVNIDENYVIGSCNIAILN